MLWLLFSTKKVRYKFCKKTGWATFWADFSQTRLSGHPAPCRGKRFERWESLFAMTRLRPSLFILVRPSGLSDYLPIYVIV
jgi:hypothetical protein